MLMLYRKSGSRNGYRCRMWNRYPELKFFVFHIRLIPEEKGMYLFALRLWVKRRTHWIWFGLALCHIKHCWLFNANYWFSYILHIWFVNNISKDLKNIAKRTKEDYLQSLVTVMAICYIARYTDVWNRHRESEIHDIHEIGSGTKIYYLWIKGYSTWGERETHTQSFYADCFYICPKPRAAPHLQTTGLASAGPESQPSRSVAGTQLTVFSQIPKILSPRFRCMT